MNDVAGVCRVCPRVIRSAKLFEGTMGVVDVLDCHRRYDQRWFGESQCPKRVDVSKTSHRAQHLP